MTDFGLASSVRESADRFSWLEDPGDDFPFYVGKPSRITGLQWCFVMFMVALGFIALTSDVLVSAGALAPYLAVILFPALPLLGLVIVAPGSWRSIFRKVGPHEAAWMLGFAALNIVVTICVALLVRQVAATDANAVVAGLAGMTAPDRLLFFVRTLPQLFGEEVATILPFLAVLHALSRAGLSRRRAVIGAWVVSAALFGAMHLPTYGWNLLQCFVIIGSARLVLTLAYIKTKNLWVSTGAHILNDWAIFGVTLVLSPGS